MAKTLFAAAAIWLTVSTLFAQSTITVTNTNADGPGSLVDAIARVDPGGTILFDPALDNSEFSTDGPSVITKDLVVDGQGGNFTITRGFFNLVIDGGASVEFRNLFFRMDTSFLVENGSTVTARNVTAKFGNAGSLATAYEGATVNMIDSDFREITEGYIMEGFDSAALRIERSRLRAARLYANSGTIDIISSEIDSDPDAPFSDQFWLVNAGATVLIDDSIFRNGGFENEAGSYEIRNSRITRQLLQGDGVGTLVQSYVTLGPRETSIVCERGSLTILNSFVRPELGQATAVKQDPGCADLDIYSSVVVGNPPVMGESAGELEAPEHYNYFFNEELDGSPYVWEYEVSGPGPLIDRGECGRANLTADHYGRPRTYDSPLPNPPGGNGCDIGPQERSAQTLPLSIRIGLSGYMLPAAPDLLPLRPPFSGEPWNYRGGERVEPGFFEANPDIVDWLLLQLRPNPSTQTQKFATGFLKSDGTVVGPDGVSPVAFWTDPDDYFVVVWHRNHLAVISASSRTIQ